MLSDSIETDPGKRRLRCPATIALLAATALAFLGQRFLENYHPGFDVDGYFALGIDGLHKGYFWQLLTFQFMHGGWWHIILNSWVIFIFGRVVELSVGSRKMLWVYFLSGAMGGLTQMLGVWIFPDLFGDGRVVGASAGAFGLVAAFAVMYPSQRLMLLLFFVIPLRMKARTLCRLFLVFAILGILMPKITSLTLMVMEHFSRYYPILMAHAREYYLQFDGLSRNVAHAAHLGGILTGTYIARRWISAYVPRVPPVIIGAKGALNITAAQD